MERNPQLQRFLYRGLGLLAMVLIPAYRLILPEDAFDPMWMRWTLSGTALVIIAFSYLPNAFENYLKQVVYAYSILATVWILGLSYANNFSYEYGSAYFIILFCSSVLYLNSRILLVYFGLNLAVTTPLLLALDDPIFSIPLFFMMLVSVSLVSSIALITKFWERDRLKADQQIYRTVNKAAFTSSGDGILVTDMLGNILHFNDLFLRMWKLTRMELAESGSSMNFHKIYQKLLNPDVFKESLRQAIDHPEREIKDLLELKDGRFIERKSVPLTENSEVLGRIWFYRDVTAIKQQEATLLASRERLHRQNDVLVQLASGKALQSGNLELAFDEITRTVTDILETHRTSIWLFENEMSSLCCRSNYHGPTDSYSRGYALKVADNPSYFDLLKEQRVFAVRDTREDDRTKFFDLPYSPAGRQRAILDVAIRTGGEIVGVLSTEVEGKQRDWARESQAFMAAIGDLITVAMEASERQKAEKQLQQSLAVLKAVFELSGIGILVTGSDQNVLDHNALYLEIWGLQRTELQSRPLEDTIQICQEQLRNKSATEQSTLSLLDNENADDYQILEFLDGRFVERFTSVLRVSGRVLGRVWFFRDITSRLKAERALRASERKNKAILNAIPDLMFRLNPEGRVVDFKVPGNSDLAALMEGVSQPVLGELFPDEFAEKVNQEAKAALEEEEVRVFEEEMEILGEPRDYEARIAQSGRGEVLLMVRDITDRKRTEKELLQRNFELDSFVYRASHDLKAPLNSLMGLIEILRSENQEPGVLTYLGLMDKSVVKLDTFIRNLTDFSRITRLEIQHNVLELEQTVREIAESLQYMENSDRVQLEIQTNKGPSLYTDSFHMGIVLGNLISNAYKYQDLKKDASEIRLSMETTEEEATIVVEDNGVGIPEAHQDRIFELFFRATTQSFGSGLGLYITRNAVQKMGGEISFSSEEGKGTRFVVKVPNRMLSEQEQADEALRQAERSRISSI